MKFTEIKYQRPNIEVVKEELLGKIAAFENAKSAEEQISLMQDIRSKRDGFESARTIVSIRHSINTKDEFYDQENSFFDKNSPEYSAVINKYYQAIVNSNYQSELSDEFGEHFINLAKSTVESFDERNIELVKKENALSTEYNKIIAGISIEVNGKKYGMNNISPLLSDSDRDVRKAAGLALYNTLQTYEGKLDEIYDDLVKTRHQMAINMGFENFIELGYKKLGRTDYNHLDVAEYRRGIKEYVVPVYKKLKARQKERIGVDEMKFYDAGFKFKSGNPKPKGDENWIVQRGEEMYAELSPETNEFFQFMKNNELMSLSAQEGKMAGGYCTFIGSHGYPFIFSNFNGTSHDIDVLTHEAGHAFQVFNSRDLPLAEYYFPTLEACEIHSMSMEFFTYPWMERFFENDVDKYKFGHMSGAISFLPYGAAIDEFQHFVYANPNISIKERNEKWLEIEADYGLANDKDGNQYLESGRFWQKQGHLYRVPFYYIDYTLAQVCAFQFWQKSTQDYGAAWKDYLNLCKLGGSLPFTQLVEKANLKTPFKKENLKDVVNMIDNFLSDINDKSM